jgi:hypothetical protein
MASEVSTGAKDSVCTGASDSEMARVEVITGVERRRRWSDDEKRAIVAESFAPGAIVAEIARRVDVSRGRFIAGARRFVPRLLGLRRC